MSAGHPTEHVEAIRFMRLCREGQFAYPELGLLYAIPNGGERHKIVAAKMKAEGGKSGVPDYCLPVLRRSPNGVYGALYIELKSMTGYASKEQKAWIEALRDAGNAAEVCRGASSAWDTIIRYLQLEGPKK